MPVGLFSDIGVLKDHLTTHQGTGLHLVLTEPGQLLAEELELDVADLLVVDVTGPHLQRVNFDQVAIAILDLSAATLLSIPGRRLVEVLANLAGREGLFLALVGPEAIHAASGLLADGQTLGLNLIPRTLLFSPIAEGTELAALLQRISRLGFRILALDGAVAAVYDPVQDTVSVNGLGSALLLAFHAQPDGQPVARLHALTQGKRSGWPEE